MMRKNKHSDRAVEKKRKELRENHRLAVIAIMQEATTEELVKQSHGGVFLKRGYDLRAPLEEKAIDCAKFTKWTAFVNVAHTLVHLVPREGDFHVRIPLYGSLARESDFNLTRIVIGRFWRD